MLQRHQKLLLYHPYPSLGVLMNMKRISRPLRSWSLLEAMEYCQVFQVHFLRKSPRLSPMRRNLSLQSNVGVLLSSCKTRFPLLVAVNCAIVIRMEGKVFTVYTCMYIPLWL